MSTVKALLVILTALSGCNLCYSQWTCYRDTGKNYFSLGCSHELLENARIEIYLDQQTLHIVCRPEPIIIDLTEFINETLELRVEHNSQELLGTIIEKCNLEDGKNFSALFKHFGIESEITSFEGFNIPPSLSEFSLEGRFSSGFEKVKKFSLHGNTIDRFKDQIFESMPEIINLDLSDNSLANLNQNVFEKLTKLKKLDLSRNKLTSLSEEMFKNQGHLTVLSLQGNNLTVLTKDIFLGLESLSVLLLNENRRSIHLNDDVFHRLPTLREITMGGSKMKVPYAIFSEQSQLERVILEQVNLANGLQLSGVKQLEIKSSEVRNISGLSNITTVSITDSILKEPLDVTSFTNLSNTTSLDLSSNRISSLVDGLFDGLTKLEELHLSTNQLTSISELVFGKLQNLTKIDISNNLLTTIHPDAFKNNNQLVTINLQNNRLSFKDGNGKTLFRHVTNLKFLDLTNNLLTRIPAELMETKKLEILNLSKNQISSVTFSEIRQNYISLNSVNETHPTFEREGYGNAHINLDGNPLECDCAMFDFLSGADQKTLAPVFCHTNFELCSHKSALNDRCPSGCSCEQIESFRHIKISCKDKKLATLPKIEFMNATSIELDISNNSLKELPLMDENLRVTFIQASHNHISKIGLENLPSTLRGVDLSHNEIRTVAADVIHYVMNHKNLEMFFLKENPLECPCWSEDTEQLLTFAAGNSSMTDLQGAKCNGNDTLSAEVVHKRCTNTAIMISLIVVTILVTIFIVIVLLFIKHREFITMWLYAHHWWVDEDNVDSSKKYDVFISYAHENRMLAYRITHALENLNVFKVCLHERDFIAGEEIEESVQRAVRSSRRTLVILSENYLTSVWCTHEFRLAWERSLTENRKLIIAVKDGELSEVTDKTIQSYIKTHTYIESNDANFWRRLVLRLPHKRTIKKILPIREWDGTPLQMSESNF